MTSRVTEKKEMRIQVANKIDDFDEIAAIDCHPEEEEKIEYESKLSFIDTTTKPGKLQLEEI